MSSGKQQDHASQQLPLFGSSVTNEDVGTPPTLVEPQPTARAVLRLVASGPNAKSRKPCVQTEDLAVIEARLIGRAKFF